MGALISPFLPVSPTFPVTPESFFSLALCLITCILLFLSHTGMGFHGHGATYSTMATCACRSLWRWFHLQHTAMIPPHAFFCIFVMACCR